MKIVMINSTTTELTTSWAGGISSALGLSATNKVVEVVVRAVRPSLYSIPFSLSPLPSPLFSPSFSPTTTPPPSHKPHHNIHHLTRNQFKKTPPTDLLPPQPLLQRVDVGPLHRIPHPRLLHDPRLHHQHVGEFPPDGVCGLDGVWGAAAGVVVGRGGGAGGGERGDWEEKGGGGRGGCWV